MRFSTLILFFVALVASSHARPELRPSWEASGLQLEVLGTDLECGYQLEASEDGVNWEKVGPAHYGNPQGWLHEVGRPTQSHLFRVGDYEIFAPRNLNDDIIDHLLNTSSPAEAEIVVTPISDSRVLLTTETTDTENGVSTRITMDFRFGLAEQDLNTYEVNLEITSIRIQVLDDGRTYTFTAKEFADETGSPFPHIIEGTMTYTAPRWGLTRVTSIDTDEHAETTELEGPID